MLTGKQESTASLGINGSLLLGWELFGIRQIGLKIICHSQGFADHLRAICEAITCSSHMLLRHCMTSEPCQYGTVIS